MNPLKIILPVLLTLGTYVNAENIIKSPSDHKEYKAITLDNGMKFLLISDPKAQRAAAAVDVKIGSADEPNEFPGLAHFLEHMLFLGTDQYPDPDDYLNYVSNHGGQHNAYTAFDHTNYFFDIDPNYLEGGLKRFSRFFIAPTLDDKYVERERNAVDSEYHSKLREDGWRNNEVFKQIVNKKHPFSRFSIGNNNTLPVATVQKALLQFYQTYYSADRMSGVILGKESIPVLEEYAKTLFKDVKNHPAVDTKIKEKLFTGTDLPKKIISQSLKDKRELSLSFPVPYLADNEYSKSLTYLGYILGYEGKGSLLAELKKRGLAHSLYAGSGQRIGEETDVEIGIELTKKGYQSQDEVIALTFYYIQKLKQDENGIKRYKQIATVAETAFKYQEKRNSIHAVSGLANQLNNFPVKNALNLNAIYSGYDLRQIKQYLSYFTPENLIVQVSSPNPVEQAQKSPYFNVPYRVEPLDVNKIKKDEAALKNTDSLFLPLSNPFIANNYDIKTPKVDHFEGKSADGITLYYKNNPEFKLPKTNIQASLQLSKTLSAKEKVALSLFAELIDDQLTQKLYDASIAGLSSSIDSGEQSLNLSIYGYSDKVPALLDIILNTIKTATFDQDRFNLIKMNETEQLENKKTEMPYQQTVEYLNAKIIKNYALTNEKIKAIQSISIVDIRSIQHQLLHSMTIKLMVYGNETQASAKNISKQFTVAFSETNLKNKWHSNETVNLEKSGQKNFTVNHADSAILYYLQSGKGYKARAEVGLLAEFIEPEFFSKMRTEKQLGYIVFAFPKPTLTQAGLAFIIQSPVAKSTELKNDITIFNQDFSKSIDKMDLDEFEKTKQILVAELTQKPDNLSEAASQYWGDILINNTTDSSRQAIADQVKKISLAEFKDFSKKLLEQAKSFVVMANPTKVAK